MILKIRKLTEKYGVWGLVKKTIAEFFRRAIYSSYFVQMYVLRRGSNVQTIRVANPTGEIRQICYEELSSLDFGIPDEDKPARLKQFKTQFTENHQCWGLICGSQIVSFTWIVLSGRIHITEVDQYLDVNETSLYLYDTVTIPRFRGNNFNPYLLAKVCSMYIDKNRLIGSLITNRASIRVIRKVGFENDKIRYLVCILGLRFKGIISLSRPCLKIYQKFFES